MKNYFVSQCLQLVTLYILLFFWGRDDWFEDQFKDLIFLLVYSMLFFMISLFSYFGRPVKIDVKLNNSLHNDEKTTTLFVKGSKLETCQEQRTIDINLKFSRQGSVWWKVVTFLSKYNNIYFSINSVPNGILLQAKDDIQRPEIKLNEKNGFDIQLNDLLTNLSDSEGEFGVSKRYQFFIVDHPDIKTFDYSTFVIRPKIILERNKMFSLLWLYHLLNNIFIKFKTEQHEIKLLKRSASYVEK